MNITFINLTYSIKDVSGHRLLHPRHYLAPLDIGYCAALLEQKGYKTTFLDTALEDLSYRDIVDKLTKPSLKEIVVIKPNEMAYALTLRLASDLKKVKGTDINVFLIGPAASTSLDYFMFKDTPVDLCIIGEPEYTLLEAAEKINNGQALDCIKGTAHFTNGKLEVEQDRDYIADLDSLPFPKYDFFIGKGYMLYYPVRMMKKKRLGLMLSSRGCPHSCVFCSPVSRVSYGKLYRARSVQNVMDEIKILDSLGVNLIYFLDDLFTYDKDRIERLCRQMIGDRLKIKWAAQCRVDDLSEGLLRLMRSAGCLCLNLGIESGSERILSMLHKNLDLGNVERMVSYCKKIGINTVGNFILGTPGERDSDRDITVKFAKRVNFNIVEVHFFTPYPGSHVFEEYGCFSKIDQYCRYEKLVHGKDLIDNDKIEKFRKYFYQAYYLRPGFLLRNIPMYMYSVILNGRDEWKLLRKVMRYIIS